MDAEIRPRRKQEQWILRVLEWPERFETGELEDVLEIIPNAPEHQMEFLKIYVADRKRRETVE